MGRNIDLRMCAHGLRVAAWAAVLGASLAACGGGGGGDSTEQPVPQPPTPPVTSPPPGIVSFSPTAGNAGTQVVISGINFAQTTGGNTVTFNGANATVMSASSTSLVVVVPAGATSGALQVTTAGGTSTSSTSFTVLSSSGTGTSWQTRTFGRHVTSPVAAAITHDGTRFVTVGSSAFEASSDAKTWTRTLEVSADDLAWNGELFVAVGSSFFVHTSPDGLTWTARSLPSGNSSSLNAVAASGAIWVAVGRSGRIVSSPDGMTWTARTSGTSKDLADVTWTGSRFVAVGADGAVVTSADGIGWTLQPAPTTDPFRAVGASSSAVVAATLLELLTSSDGGASWTPQPAPAAFNEIIHADGRFVAVGFSETATSIDGVVWESSEQIPSTLDSVVHDGHKYVAIGTDWNSVGSVLTSPDGLSWTLVQSAHSLRRVAQSAADGRLVGVGNSHMVRTSTDGGATWTFAPITTNIALNLPFLDLVWSPSAGAFIGHVIVAANQDAYSSVDGATWTRLGDMPCHGALAASPTRMVNVGSSLAGSCISISDDGTSWTEVTSPSSSTFSGVIWTGSQFVATGGGGLIATSADGLAWTARSSGVSSTLHGGTASASVVVVVGSSGTIVTSIDGGVSWTPRSSGTIADLRHAAFTGSEFFVVGSGGVLLRSTTGTTWSHQATPYTADLGDILWLPGSSKLVLAGESGLIATSP